MTRSSLFSVPLALLLLSLSSACVSDDGREEQIYAGYGDDGDSGEEESESQPEQPPEELAAMFDAAAEEFDVPSIILSAG